MHDRSVYDVYDRCVHICPPVVCAFDANNPQIFFGEYYSKGKGRTVRTITGPNNAGNPTVEVRWREMAGGTLPSSPFASVSLPSPRLKLLSPRLTSPCHSRRPPLMSSISCPSAPTSPPMCGPQVLHPCIISTTKLGSLFSATTILPTSHTRTAGGRPYPPLNNDNEPFLKVFFSISSVPTTLQHRSPFRCIP